jgi:hypothetical protein
VIKASWLVVGIVGVLIGFGQTIKVKGLTVAHGIIVKPDVTKTYAVGIYETIEVIVDK